MRRRWGRWRGYMDELEELMRVAADQLAEVESILARVFERPLWRGARRGALGVATGCH